MRPVSLPIILRDVAAWMIAGMILLKQAGILFDPPSQVSDTLVWVAAGLIGGPGMLQVLQARFGRNTSTDERSPSPPPRESSPSSPGES